MSRAPVRHVIYLHGFASSPDSSKAQRFGQELTARGVGFACPDLNLPTFETLTTSRMLAQVRDEVARAPDGPIALVGSSLGSFVALHAADQDVTGRIDRLVLMAPALDFGGNRLQQLGPHGIDEWRRTGSIRVFHYAEGRNYDVGFALYEDAAAYDARALAVRWPTLVFQGEHDDTVDPTMVRAWAEEQEAVDLRLLSDGHQLADSIEEIWSESARFLGVPAL